ncbi:PIG-L deacetylase family protein [Longispora urticae]
MPGPGRTVLAVSPHLDDAVLSVGATLAGWAGAGGTVVVCTVFAGDPPPVLSDAGRAFHAHAGLGADAVGARRREDVRALAVLDARPHHLGFVDAIYRDLDGRWLYAGPGAAVDPTWPPEPGLRAELRRVLAGLVGEVRPDLVLTCSAAGGHVDHRLVRDAVVAVVTDAGTELLLWEDLPYALDREPSRAQVPVPSARIGPGAVDRKLAAVGHYASQVRALWPDGYDWRGALAGHLARRQAAGYPGEPLWAVTDADRSLARDAGPTTTGPASA